MEELTLSALVPLWVSSRTYRPNSERQRLSIMRRFVVEVGDVRPADLDALGVLRWWDSTARLAPASRRAYYSAVASFIEFLNALGLMHSNPLLAVRRPRQPRGVPRALSTDELDRLWAAVADDASMRMAVALGVGAGLRVGEVVKVRQRDVMRDDDPVLLLVRDGKGGHTDIVPVVHPWLLAELDATSDEHGRLVPFAASTLTIKASRLMHDLGIDDSFHALRHTFATNLLRSGLDVRTVSSRMRHRDLSTTSRYLAPL